VTLIARADVALSVVMTRRAPSGLWCSPLRSLGFWPVVYVLWTGWKLLLDVLQVVLLPWARRHWPQRGTPRLGPLDAGPFVPPLASAGDCSIVASIVGSQRLKALLEQGPLLFLGGGCLLHGGGFPAGWLDPRGRSSSRFWWR